MRIGVFGGTFDPPHIGHLRAAIEALEILHLDLVLLVVANTPWQKVGTRAITSASVRFEMVQASVEGLDGVEASDIEIRRGGNSYTVDTLRDLHELHPAAEFVVLAGADIVEALPSWREPEALPALAALAVFDRPVVTGSTELRRLSVDDRGEVVPAPVVAPGAVWPAQRVPVPYLDVSSSDVRDRTRAGRSVALLVPAPVATMIVSRGIYRDGSMTGVAE